MKTTATMKLVGFTLAALMALAGCNGGEQGPAEKAGEQVDEAVEDTTNAAEDAADEAGDAVEEAGDKVENATD